MGPTTGVAEGSVPQVAGHAAAASRAAASMRCRRGGLRWATAPCRGGTPVVVRIGVVVDGNCRPVVPARQTAAAVALRVGRRGGRVGGSGPAAAIGRTAAPRARRLPPQTGPGHDRVGRSRQEAAKVPAVWVQGPVRASLSAARNQNLLGPSSRVLSARRRRGRSLHISFAVRRRGYRPLSSINHTGPAPSHTGTGVRRDGPANVVRPSRWPRTGR